MDYDEKEKIMAYLENEGLRLHTELENAKRSYYTDRSIFACMALLRAQIAYSSFKKFSHDIYTLTEYPY